jgi:tetratricopeptide (TPR) repeat protein
MPRIVLVLVALAGAASCDASRRLPTVVWSARVETGASSFAGVSAQAVREAARTWPEPKTGPAPVELTASDGTGLRLVELDARAVVHGPLAFTELHLAFENPDDRVLEGRFSLSLPPAASVARVAMSIEGTWQEAEVVPRIKAHTTYETYLHRRVDPALAEIGTDRRFHVRVFPIPARGRKELIVSWSQPIPRREGPYRLPLAGLPVVDRLRASVIADGVRRDFALDGRAPDGDLVVPLTGPSGIRHDRGALLRVRPTLDPRPDPLAELTVLVDTSASRGRSFGRDVDRVGALVAELARRHGGALSLRVGGFDQSVAWIHDGPAGALDAEAAEDGLRLRRPLGASNLSGALAWLGRGRGRLLLVTDAIPSAGELSPEKVAAVLRRAGFERVDVLLFEGGDELMARRLVSGAAKREGAVLSAELAAADIVDALGRRTVSGIRVSVPGAASVHPSVLDAVQAGEDRLIAVSGLPAGGRVDIVLGGAVEERQTLFAPMAPAALVERALAGARIAQLEAQGDKTRDEVVRLSQRHRVLSRSTALLVLESEADYARFGIDVTKGDLLVVGRSGLRVVRRRPMPRPTGKLPLDAQAANGPVPVGTATVGSSSITGVVTDRQTGGPLAGVTVVATSPSLQGTPAAITDEAGRYLIPNLPPGSYRVTFYYTDLTVERTLRLGSGAARLHLTLDTRAAGGEVIAIQDRAPSIDVASTNQGITIDQQYIRQIPVPGRTFEGALAGASRAENAYVVDGLAGDFPREPELRLDGAPPRSKALVDLLAAHAARPNDLFVLIALGEALAASREPILAARAYGSLVDLAPRAEILRHAAGRLSSLGEPGLDLALDAYARAAADRPDQVHGRRLLAFALARRGRPDRAFDVIDGALDAELPAARAESLREILRQDLAVLGAAWLRRDPRATGTVLARLARRDLRVADQATLRVILTWETDADDLDLHVFDVDGQEVSPASPLLPDYAGYLVGDAADGHGPEAVVFDAPDAWPYRARVRLSSRGPGGHSLAIVQFLYHDGRGGLAFEERPLALLEQGAVADAGEVSFVR